MHKMTAFSFLKIHMMVAMNIGTNDPIRINNTPACSFVHDNVLKILAKVHILYDIGSFYSFFYF